MKLISTPIKTTTFTRVIAKRMVWDFSRPFFLNFFLSLITILQLVLSLKQILLSRFKVNYQLENQINKN